MVADSNHSPNGPDRSEAPEGVPGAGFAVVRRGYDPDAVEGRRVQALDWEGDGPKPSGARESAGTKQAEIPEWPYNNA